MNQRSAEDARPAAGSGDAPLRIVGPLIAFVIGAGLGFLLGGQSQSLGGGYEGGLPRNLGPNVMTLALAVFVGLGGLVLLVPRSTRSFGGALLLAAAGVGVGFVAAGVLVPENPGAQTLGGTVRVELTSPEGTFEGPASCETPSAPGRGFLVNAALGNLGDDRLSVWVVHFRGQESASLTFRLNEGRDAYEGTGPVETTADQRTGRATFANLTSRTGPIAGAPASLSGTLTWSCGGAAGVPIAP